MVLYILIALKLYCYSQLGGGSLKRTNNIENNTHKTKRVKQEASSSSHPSAAQSDKVHCDACGILVCKKYFTNHLKSNRHKTKASKLHDNLQNVYVVESAFGQRIISYKINSKSDGSFETPEIFLNSIHNDIQSLIEESILKHTVFKVNFVLHADFIQQTKNISNSFDFQTSNYIIFQGDDLNIFFSSLRDTFINKINTFEKKDSGWTLNFIKSLDMNVNKFNPLRGSSYIDLPRDIIVKKAIINVKNVDVLCLKWALLSALYPVNKNPDRVSSYSMHCNKLKFDGVSFPVKLSDMSKVEKLNNISINVFGLEFDKINKTHSVVGPLYFTKCRKSIHVNLLLLSSERNNHYCYIKNMSRLVRNQISRHEHAIYICDGCLLHFPSQVKLTEHQQHDCFHIKTELPDSQKTSENWFGQSVSNDKLKFDKFNKKLKTPFVVYADFEAFLTPIESCSNDPLKSYTSNIQKHEVYSFGYYIKCSYDDNLSKYETYCGPNSTQEFMIRLHKDLKFICTKNSTEVAPKALSNDDYIKVSTSDTCFICETHLNGEREFNYNPQTGHFRGVAHNICNSKFRIPNYIPVILHNLSHYDSHFIVHALNFVDGDIEVIPQTKEKYISFSKTLQINNKIVQLRFIDSIKFLPCGLSQLANNLIDKEFISLKRNFPVNEDFNLVRKKGIYPYEFMTSFECLNLTSLPDKNKFYSSLSDSHISDNDYNHAKNVWQNFNCKNMLDYSNLYLKTDVLLLTDIFENFRMLCLQTYGLDPTHYYTAPGLSWDAMLKITKIELELLTDIEKISFITRGIRGGISQCSKRYAKANNPFMEGFDKNLSTSYLMYFDANNLYGWAMSQYLPSGGFEWVDIKTDYSASNNTEYGFILEVDLEYPIHIHDLHSDLPLCPEKISVGDSKDVKLVPNLYNKTKYIIHYKNLQQCINLGMKLKKIHRILKFNQSLWLKKYIDLNTNLRMQAKTDFEKDFYKLMNNSVFGKTMENVEKRVNVKLLTHWENVGKSLGAQDFIAKPEFHSLSIFSENLVAIQLKRTKALHNKPIYLGFCILDISKTLMYDFHYNYMLPKFPNKIKLLYTDTDSLVYEIITNNFYEDIKPDLPEWFDTSDYPLNNIYEYQNINKKKLGMFKDENAGKILREFVGLRSKMYALDIDNTFLAKAKGVNKSVTKSFKMDDYKSCLFNENVQYRTMLRFRSIKHNIFTQQINKKCLSHNDTKRYIVSNNVNTLAWGHYKIPID